MMGRWNVNSVQRWLACTVVAVLAFLYLGRNNVPEQTRLPNISKNGSSFRIKSSVEKRVVVVQAAGQVEPLTIDQGER